MMKKLIVSIVAMLAVPAMTMAAGFELPAVTEALPGTTVEIPISAVGSPANIQGVNLNLESDAALVFVGVTFDTGVFAGNYTPPNVTVEPPYLIASTTTNSGTVALPGVIATITLNVPDGTAEGDYFVRTFVPDYEVVSDFADVVIPPEFQGAGVVRVVPEPATALLLLAAGAFLRRRHS